MNHTINDVVWLLLVQAFQNWAQFSRYALLERTVPSVRVAYAQGSFRHICSVSIDLTWIFVFYYVFFFIDFIVQNRFLRRSRNWKNNNLVDVSCWFDCCAYLLGRYFRTSMSKSTEQGQSEHFEGRFLSLVGPTMSRQVVILRWSGTRGGRRLYQTK